MTYGEAITRLCQLRDKLAGADAKAVSWAIQQIRAPEGWISVKDRLPDLIQIGAGAAYSDAVIVLTTGRKAMIAVWNGINWFCAFDFWDAWGEEITHWMPLPERMPEEAYHIAKGGSYGQAERK